MDARSSLAALTILAATVCGAAADIVYMYDELGRLVRVIREDGDAASYHYDPVGNLLQITREHRLGQTTSIASTSRATGGRGATIPLIIEGTNLIGASVVCTTEGLEVQAVRTEFDRITLELFVSPTAPLGAGTCEVRGVTVAPFAFTVTAAPGPTFLAGSAVSVARAAPLASLDRTVASALSVAVGAAAPTFAVAPDVAVGWDGSQLFTVE